MRNQSALVTGGAVRIGKSICLCLAEMGYDIVLHYGDSQDEAESTRVLIEELGVRCQLISQNLEEASAGTKIFDQIDPSFQIEILVNNAAIFIPSGFDDESVDLLDLHYKINFRSSYSLIKCFVNRYKSGHIINILDTKITQYQTEHLDYLIFKKALHDLTMITARTCGPRFRANGIAPGLILPPEGKDQNYLEQKARHIPLQQTGNTSIIQNAVRYLVKNPLLTGQILYNDGGEHLL